MTTTVKITDDIKQATLGVAQPATTYLTYDVGIPDHEYNPILARLVGPLPADLTQTVTAKIFRNDGSDTGVTATFTLNSASQWAPWPSTILFTPPNAQPNWLGILYVDDTFFGTNSGVKWSGAIPDKTKCYTGIGKTGSWPPSGGLTKDEGDALKFILNNPSVQGLLDSATNRQKFGAAVQKLLRRIG